MGPRADGFSQMAFVTQGPDLGFLSVSPPTGGEGRAYPQAHPKLIFR